MVRVYICSNLKNIENIIKKDHVVISIAPGISIDSLKDALGFDARIVRAMPNTPALINYGATAISRTPNIDNETFNKVKQIFESIGRIEKTILSNEM